MAKESWRWTFLSYESQEEPFPVEDWFKALPENHRFEILYLLNTMSVATRSQWRKPEFDPLNGAGGISEIRIPDIRDESGASYHRIYGFFGPEKREYCFLHGNSKEEKNDLEGKSTGERRLEQLTKGEANVHKFAQP